MEFSGAAAVSIRCTNKNYIHNSRYLFSSSIALLKLSSFSVIVDVAHFPQI
jgi:hypothetical protein